MYVKITNGAVDQFPYTVGQLRRDNPNTSFPKKVSDQVLSSYNVFPVVRQAVPDYDQRTHYMEWDENPVLTNGEWFLGVSVLEKTEEEIVEYDNAHAMFMRERRDEKLKETDWWALSDLSITSEQASYRQALRDITDHADWPWINESVWPTKP